MGRKVKKQDVANLGETRQVEHGNARDAVVAEQHLPHFRSLARAVGRGQRGHAAHANVVQRLCPRGIRAQRPQHGAQVAVGKRAGSRRGRRPFVRGREPAPMRRLAVCRHRPARRRVIRHRGFARHLPAHGRETVCHRAACRHQPARRLTARRHHARARMDDGPVGEPHVVAAARARGRVDAHRLPVAHHAHPPPRELQTQHVKHARSLVRQRVEPALPFLAPHKPQVGEERMHGIGARVASRAGAGRKIRVETGTGGKAKGGGDRITQGVKRRRDEGHIAIHAGVHMRVREVAPPIARGQNGAPHAFVGLEHHHLGARRRHARSRRGRRKARRAATYDRYRFHAPIIRHVAHAACRPHPRGWGFLPLFRRFPTSPAPGPVKEKSRPALLQGIGRRQPPKGHGTCRNRQKSGRKPLPGACSRTPHAKRRTQAETHVRPTRRTPCRPRPACRRHPARRPPRTASRAPRAPGQRPGGAPAATCSPPWGWASRPSRRGSCPTRSASSRARSGPKAPEPR